MLAQVQGRKKLIIFPPEHTSNLYPFPSFSSQSHASRINVQAIYSDDPELREAERRRFPKALNAERYECVLEKGEILYMPPGWWHDVESLDDAISVTIPWDMEPGDCVPPNMFN